MKDIYFVLLGLGSAILKDADRVMDRLLDYFVPIKPICIEDDI